MSRRKDRERFIQRKRQDPGYVGFRGGQTAAETTPAANLETVTCSVCQRRRNVPSDTIPDDRDSFVCLQCQESQSTGILSV